MNAIAKTFFRIKKKQTAASEMKKESNEDKSKKKNHQILFLFYFKQYFQYKCFDTRIRLSTRKMN
jgi:hypothetical protein